MSSAFGEPPDSGVRDVREGAGRRDQEQRQKRAEGGAAHDGGRCGKARGIISGRRTRAFISADQARSAPRAPSAGQLPVKRGVALLDERGDALHEVLRPRERVLEVGLQVELPVHVGVEHLVERPLRCRRRSGSGRRPAAPRARPASAISPSSGWTSLTRPHSSACWRGHPLAEQRHLEGARLAHGRGHEQGRAAVRHQADVHEGQAEERRLGRQDEVAGEAPARLRCPRRGRSRRRRPASRAGACR